MSMQLIETVSLSGTSKTISNIPQTFTDLYLVFSIKTDGSSTDRILNMDINGDTNSNYQYHRHIVYTGSSNVGYVNSNTNANEIGYSSDGSSNGFGVITLYIPNYRTNLIKKHHSESVADNTVSAVAFARYTNLWNSTAAITSLRFWPQSNWNMSGKVSIYGITSGTGGATVS